MSLAPGENRRTVCPWQCTDFAGDRTNIGRATSIRPRPLLQNHVPHFRIFQLVEHQLDVPFPIRIIHALEFLDSVVLDLIQPLLPSRFVRDHDGFADPLRHQRLHLSGERIVDLLLRHLPLGLAGNGLQFANLRHNLLDLSMGEFDRLKHDGFGQFVRPCFDHHDRIRRSRHNEVKLALRYRFKIRIHNELAIQSTDPHACNRIVKWNIRDG